MSATSSPAADAERMLKFEVARAVYAVPIAEVHEVAEAGCIRCVPTLDPNLVGVMNWHGDALPVVSAALLFDGSEFEGDPEIEEGDAPEESGTGLDAEHVLVVSGRDDEPARLGIPIDRIIGLVDGPRRPRGGESLVVDRQEVDGRVVNVLDPQRLVARAMEVIATEVC